MALTKVSTDGVKDDAITKTKIPANQIEASELADNAVDTNAIANNAVTAGKLASGVTDLSNDTSPQLGGTLDLNSNHVSGILENRQNSTTTDFSVLSNPALSSSGISSQNIQGAFNVFNALTLVSHSANSVGMSGSFIVKNHSGSGYSPSIFITQRDGGNSQRILQEMTKDGACKLNHGGNTKLQTTNSGATVTGSIAAGGATLTSGSLNMSSSHMQFSGNLSLPNVGACIFRPVADTIAFGINNGQRVSVNQHGLLFGSDTAAANALDDYEEGTWTPAYTLGSGSGFTMSAATYSASNTGGTYQKIGRLVTFALRIQCSSHTINNGAQVVIGGLPFTATNSSDVGTQAGAQFSYAQAICTSNNGYIPQMHIPNNNTTIQFYTCNGNDYQTGDGNNNFSLTLHIHGQYITNT